jgi:hypothetical protein
MIYELTVPQFSKALGNLSAILDKGLAYSDTKKFDVAVLLESRLAPDQFNLIRQIQIACDTAKLAVASLANKDAPIHEDKEKTLPELKARIESTLGFLGTVQRKDFEGAQDRKISRPRWEGKHMSGEDFVIQHAIPNFYFHLTTAYSILRHNGVDIGKKDYLGSLPYKS